jgi:hypothetical protein
MSPKNPESTVRTVSFITVTGEPTKAARDQARKESTQIRRKERKEQKQHKEREETLAALILLENERTQTKALVGNMTSSSIALEPPCIHRFSATREDPFIKYPYKLSYNERKLLDQCRFFRSHYYLETH